MRADATTSRVAVGSVLASIAAPIAAQAAARTTASWVGEAYPSAAVTLAALAIAAIAGAWALARGRPAARVGAAAAVGVGAVLALQTGAPWTALAAAAAAGWVATRGLATLTAGAAVPRGRAAVFWGILAVAGALQVGRMSVYLGDPTATWGAFAPSEFMRRHSCLSSYANGAALARRGDANIYDDRYGSTIDTPAELPSAVDIGPLTMDTYEYPPQFLLLPRALQALTGDFLALRAVWFLLSAATLAWAVVALARWLGGDADRRMRLLGLALAMTPSVLITLYFGNAQVIVVAIAALGMLRIHQGRAPIGGALLAAAISAKIFPGLLGVYLIATRRWAAVAWTTAFGALYAGLALLAFGTRPFRDFFGYHVPRLSSGETFAFLAEPAAVPANLALFGVPFKLRLLGLDMSLETAWSIAPRIAWGYTAAIVLAAAVLGLRARPAVDPRSRAIAAAGWLGLIALGALRSPFAPGEVLIPVFWALLLRAAAAGSRREAAVAGGLAAAMCLYTPAPTPAGAAATLVFQLVMFAALAWAMRGGASAPSPA